MCWSWNMSERAAWVRFECTRDWTRRKLFEHVSWTISQASVPLLHGLLSDMLRLLKASIKHYLVEDRGLRVLGVLGAHALRRGRRAGVGERGACERHRELTLTVALARGRTRERTRARRRKRRGLRLRLRFGHRCTRPIRSLWWGPSRDRFLVGVRAGWGCGWGPGNDLRWTRIR